jgi:hypothetical protein
MEKTTTTARPAKARSERLPRQTLGDPSRLCSLQDQITLGESTPQTRPPKIIGGTGVSITRHGGSNDSVMEIRGGEKAEFRRIKINGKRSGTNYHRALRISGSGTEVTRGDGTMVRVPAFW